MRIKKLDERVRLLQQLNGFSHKLGEMYYVVGDSATPDELAELTSLCQAAIKLPIYTVAYAAAWLGMSKRGIVEAYRAKRLRYIQPGREVLFLHDDLVEFVKQRRYEL